MKNPAQEKKDFVISLLKKYGEYDKNINRESMDKKTVDRICKVLITKDEKKRNELLNSYKQEEIKQMKEKRKKAEQLLAKVKKLSTQMKEAKSKLSDEKDIENLEEQIHSS